MKKWVLLSLTFLLIGSASKEASAAKGDFAVRSERVSTTDFGYEKPFRTTAIIKGSCSKADIPQSDSRNLKWLYKKGADIKDRARIQKLGVLYYNNLGQEIVCFDDLAVIPFVLVNVANEMVDVAGWTASGKEYDLQHDEIIIVESLELIKKNVDAE